MRKPTLFRKLFPKFLILSLTGFLALLYLGRYHFKNFYHDEKTLHLKNMATVLKKPVLGYIKVKDIKKLRGFIDQRARESQQRISVILIDGRVIADSSKNPDLLDDHGKRPEVIEALKGNVARIRRFSDSLNEDSIYVAVPLFDNGKVLAVLRHSYTTHALRPALWSYTYKVFWGTMILGVLFTILLTLTSKRVSSSLYRIQEKASDYALGNFSESIPVNSNDTFEINSLVHSLNEMAKKLGSLFKKIQGQRNEREAIFSGMSEGVLSVYMDGGIFHLNEAVCNFFDVPYSHDYKGVPLLDVFDNNQIYYFIDQVKEQSSVIEEEIELRNGKYLQVHGSILKQFNGDDLGILMVFNDITRIVKLENHRKDFVANVSHELRTPLTSIHGYVDILLAGEIDSDETRNEFLLIIKRNSERLRQITEDLLALSELDIERDQKSVQIELTELAPIIENAASACEAKAKHKEINLKVDSKGDALVSVNSRLIEQAVLNLIDNAIKYSDEKTNISITLRPNEVEKTISIVVADQGPGISKVHLERIFERFYSVDKARCRELGGSGLGLSIVKNIALVHEGSVHAESVEGEGSKFTITLPISHES